MTQKICGACGAEFSCSAPRGRCWCEAVKAGGEALAALRARYADCLCPRCLAAAAGGKELASALQAPESPRRPGGNRSAMMQRRNANGALQRCHWASSPIEIAYHDDEWGVPLHDDLRLFEFLILEGAQAGLNWETILKKRENYRRAFDGFDPAKIACYDRRKVRELLANSGIVRNRLKITATISNARAFLAVQEEMDSFDRYVWQFIGGRPRVNRWWSPRRVPARTPESDAMSEDLKKRGFRFVGATICYAFMQAVGMVNDHAVDCFRREQIR